MIRSEGISSSADHESDHDTAQTLADCLVQVSFSIGAAVRISYLLFSIVA